MMEQWNIGILGTFVFHLVEKYYPFFAAMLNKLWSLTWYAYIGASLLDPRFSIQYMGRYTKRAVMAEYRTPPGRGDGKIVRFSYKDYAQGAKTSYMTLKVYTFIGRLIRHIPRSGVGPIQEWGRTKVEPSQRRHELKIMAVFRS